jgi:signal transduction histidine kinase/CheY-like chemotaxis protein
MRLFFVAIAVVETNRRLVAEIEERQRAEASLATRARLEALVNSISADFLALPAGECERGWPGALEKIGETLHADAVRLYLLHDQRPEISCCHEWCHPDHSDRRGCLHDRPFAPASSRTPRSLLRFPASGGEDEGNPALAAEIAELHRMGSVILAPLIEQDRLIGYLSLESIEPRDWPAEAIDLLRMVMSAFAHTVHRARVDREKRRLQEQLTRAQRMEAVGQLSGGIAHDFNNTLLPIIGYADLLLARLPEDDPTVSELTEIRRAAQHAATLTRQLLAVSKKQVVNKVVFDLNEELCAMRTLLQRVIGEDITLELRLEEGLPAILADPGQIQQVVMNLGVNSRDAMPRGGVVVLRTYRVDAGSQIPLINGHVATGPLVCLSVEDSGTGIAPEIRDRIFDPFFSTKGNEGTGLGLAVIFSIVEQHHGGIDVETAVGAGTSFRVFLPASDKAPAAAPIGPAAREAMPLGHGQRILLVEDEDAVNRFVTTALSKHGYEVLSAVDVRQAWHVFEREKGRFDLVFSDAVLPDGNGVDLIGRLLRTRPEMRALLSSGHTDKEALLRLAVEREISFLQKPYSLPDLLRTVNDVLNGTHQSVLN